MADDKKSFSRRQLLQFSAAAGVTAILGEPVSFAETQQSGPRAPVSAPAEELVFINGKIHTMDRNNTVVQTVSIKNGRFSTVGGAVPRRGPGIRIIDLRGRTVVPGIIDNHNHIMRVGNRPGYHTPLENAYSIRNVQETIAARAKGIPRGAWITTIGGFHRNHLFSPNQTPRLPTLTELDEAAPNNPVYISESFTGPSTTNTLGKKFFETQAPPIPVSLDGEIAMGAQGTGLATLALRQTLLTLDQRRRGALDAMNYG